MISDRIEQELVDALKAKDSATIDTLRLLKAAFQNAQIQHGKTLDEQAQIAIVRSQVKQRDEAAEQFEKAQRPELAQKERDQAKILQRYLPAQPSREDLSGAVKAAISETGATSAQDMGKVMGALKQKLDPSVDMGQVAKIVQVQLSAQ